MTAGAAESQRRQSARGRAVRYIADIGRVGAGSYFFAESRAARQVRGRIMGGLYTAAALAGLASLVLGSNQGVSAPRYLMVTLIAVAVLAAGLLVALFAAHLGKVAAHLGSAAMTAVVGAVQAVADGETTVVETGFIYIWVAVFSALFFQPLAIAAHLVWITVVQTVAMMLTDAEPLAEASQIASHVVLAAGTSIAAAVVVAIPMAHLRSKAGLDAMTGLANRTRILAELDAALRHAPRQNVTVVMIAISGLRTINRHHGQSVGDAVVREAARRVSRTAHGLRVGRFAGDEFVVISESSDPRHAVELARELVATLQEPTRVRQVDVSMRATAGIATADGRAAKVDALLVGAVAALAEAQRVPGGVAIFDAALRERIEADNHLDQALEVALKRGEFELHYQPIIDLTTRRMTGVEALIRWHRPGFGMVPPDVFIPRAEQSDLICDIGGWVLDQAASHMAGQPGFADLYVSVNISGRHLMSGSLIDDVCSACQRAGIDPTRLIIEITETVLTDIPGSIDTLHSLRELGCKVAIDDFGTGHTSIGQLLSMPFDILKIDRSFVDESDHAKRDLVELMIRAAHTADAEVTAEGIENAETAEVLRRSGVDFGQGYHFAKPSPAGRIASLHFS